MKALEFDGQTANHRQIRVPPQIADQIPEGSVVRVILLLDAGEDESRRQLCLNRFSAAYSEEDAVYEKLDNGPAGPAGLARRWIERAFDSQAP